MTDIEELVRESLRTAPPVVPSSSDPLGLVSRRVRRARALWGGGVAALVAIVVTAVVVPLALRDSASGRLLPTTPSPTATTVRHGVTTWDKTAVAVAAGDGYLWELRRDPSANDGAGFLVKLDPATHRALGQWDVRAPFDFMTFGLGHVWVWGGGDGGYPDGLLQTFNASSADGCPCTAAGYHGAGYGGVAFLGGHAWVTVGPMLAELSPGGSQVWAHALPPGDAPGAVFAVGGRLFVQTSPTSTQQMIPDADGIGAHPGLASSVADAVERMLAVQGTDTLLISTGTDVEQWRNYGTETVSNAVLESGVGQAVTLPNGDVVVSTLGFENGSAAPALWLVTADAGGLLCQTCVTKIAGDVSVVSLAVNPVGGVDFVLDDETAGHWQP